MKIYKRPSKDFLYKRKGPWPQPCPEYPNSGPPAVLNVPFIEAIDWWHKIGSRYIMTLAFSPLSYVKGCLKPGLSKITDQDFEEILNDTLFCQFVKETFSNHDLKLFPEINKNKNEYAIFDMSPVTVVKTFKGIYASATKTLLKKDKDRLIPIAIYLEKTNCVLTPEDGENWELAKFFVMQGGALCATLVIHPLIHFPTDAINAITKTSLPKDHLIFQLLYPHLRFTLYLENAVLTFKTSLLESKWWMPYAPYPGPRKSLRKLLIEGYRGIKGSPSYEAYKFERKPRFNETRYSYFLEKYFNVIRDFVANIFEYLTEEEKYFLKQWSHHIRQHVKGFPSEKNFIKDQDVQIDFISHYLWNITVAHSLDHYSFGNLDIRKVPLRIREKPPKKGDQFKLDLKKLCRFWDYGKHEMANTLFFKPSLVTSLIDTKYNFGERNSELQRYVDKFHADLKELDEYFIKENLQLIPLKEIAASIQY